MSRVEQAQADVPDLVDTRSGRIDILRLYLMEIGQFPRMSLEEEQSKGASILNGQVILRGLELLRDSSLFTEAQRTDIDYLLSHEEAERFLDVFNDHPDEKPHGKNGVSANSEKLPGRNKLVENYTRRLKAKLKTTEQLNGSSIGNNCDEVLQSQIALAKQAIADYHELVQRNLRLVVAPAIKAATRNDVSMPLMDLIQEGNQGLMRAAIKFDNRYGYRFVTYADWWIRQAINIAISYKDKHIRKPVHQQAIIREVNKIGERLGYTPTHEQLITIASKILGKTPLQLRTAMFVFKMISLETQAEDEDGEIGPLENAIGVEQKSAYDEVERNELKDKLKQALNLLTESERKVIELRYGLEDGKGRTLDQVAREIGVTTRERARQIEAQALAKMREYCADLRVYLTDDPKGEKGLTPGRVIGKVA